MKECRLEPQGFRAFHRGSEQGIEGVKSESFMRGIEWIVETIVIEIIVSGESHQVTVKRPQFFLIVERIDVPSGHPSEPEVVSITGDARTKVILRSLHQRFLRCGQRRVRVAAVKTAVGNFSLEEVPNVVDCSPRIGRITGKEECATGCGHDHANNRGCHVGDLRVHSASNIETDSGHTGDVEAK